MAKADKIATIASLVRIAARSEPEFTETVISMFEDEPTERIAEFFDRLNIPRSQGADSGLNDPIPDLTAANVNHGNFNEERAISQGVQKFLERHVRKIKWHAGHPSLEGSENVLLLVRAAMSTTNLRLERLIKLLESKDELTPLEWSISRELMNRSYLTFRNFLDLMGSDWIDAMQNTVAPDELADKLGNFYELVDQEVRKLEEYRTRIEDRRLELTVIPEGYPPVKPPNYFGGDLMGRGPWKQFWNNVDAKAHHFRESLG